MTTETTTISGRPDAAPLDGTERVIMDQGDDTVDASTQDIANLAPGTDLDYAPETRTLISSTGEGVQLPLATVLLAGLMSAAAMARLEQLGADDSPTFAGLTITGTAAVAIPHIHGALAGPSYIHVKNTGSVTLSKGTPVYTVGTVGDTTTLEVQKADSANSLKMPAVGLLDADLAPNDLGHAIVVGELTGAPTAGYAVNAPLYVAAGGGVTATRPTTGIVQQVAIVGRAHATTGSLTATIGPQLNPLWDTAYSERLQWNGGSTGLDPVAGRASLLLGSAAQASTGDFASAAQGTKADSAVQPATLSSALSTKADLVGGVIPTSQIPAIAISDYLGAVGSQAAMLALVGQRGDWCLRTDPGAVGQWILSGDNAALLANWVQIPVPVAPVQSVNDQTGVIVLAPGDIGAAASGAIANSGLTMTGPGVAGRSSGPGALETLTLGPNLSIVDGVLTVPTLSNAAAQNLAASAAAGTSGDLARADHVHQFQPSDVMIPLLGDQVSLTNTTILTCPDWIRSIVITALPRWTLVTAPAGSAAQFDIRVGGVSIFATLPTIDATEQSSSTAAIPAVFSTPFINGTSPFTAPYTINAGTTVTFHCTQVGSTTAGAGLKLAIPTRRAS